MREPFNQIKKRKDIIGAEIGVFRGFNALDILRGLRPKMLYLVDPYLDYECHGGREITGMSAAREAAHTRLAPHAGNIRWLEESSAQASFEIPDDSLDFVYIDANHTYAHVLQDIELWTPKVKIGGLVAGHDFTGRAGVRRAVREFCQHLRFNLFRAKHGSDWWFFRS